MIDWGDFNNTSIISDTSLSAIIQISTSPPPPVHQVPRWGALDAGREWANFHWSPFGKLDDLVAFHFEGGQWKNGADYDAGKDGAAAGKQRGSVGKGRRRTSKAEQRKETFKHVNNARKVKSEDSEKLNGRVNINDKDMGHPRADPRHRASQASGRNDVSGMELFFGVDSYFGIGERRDSEEGANDMGGESDGKVGYSSSYSRVHATHDNKKSQTNSTSFSKPGSGTAFNNHSCAHRQLNEAQRQYVMGRQLKFSDLPDRITDCMQTGST
jgi:hypothetical protein